MFKSKDLTFNDEEELYAFVKERFESEKAKARFESSTRITIKHWTIKYIGKEQFEEYEGKMAMLREKVRGVKALGDLGTQSIFCFEAVSADKVACRINGCWCEFCCSVPLKLVNNDSRIDFPQCRHPEETFNVLKMTIQPRMQVIAPQDEDFSEPEDENEVEPAANGQ